MQFELKLIPLLRRPYDDCVTALRDVIKPMLVAKNAYSYVYISIWPFVYKVDNRNLMCIFLIDFEFSSVNNLNFQFFVFSTVILTVQKLQNDNLTSMTLFANFRWRVWYKICQNN